jgi:hypothetical protein
MCAHSVCLPTPAQARELVRRHPDRMAVYKFDNLGDGVGVVAPATVGRADEVLTRTNLGPCTFFKDGGCELHGSALKPFEGQIAHHTRGWMPVRAVALSKWKGKQFQSVATSLAKHRGP